MDRKKTILIAVIINAGLLVVLFIAALATQEEVVSGDFAQKAPAGPLFPELADHSLRQPLASSPPVLPLLATPSVSEPMKEPAAASTPPVAEAPIVHRLPAPVQEPVAKTPPAAPLPTPSFVEVVVKKGDSLDKIAKAHHITVEEIIQSNQLPGSFLKVGQVLRIPEGKSVVVTAKSKPILDKQPALAGPEYYTVKVGDNPWGIAMKHHMKVEELLKLNNLNEERARKLKPGDRLRTR